MFTKKGREAQINGLYIELLNNPEMVFYASNVEIARIEFGNGGVILKDGAIHFKESETVALIGATPTRAVIMGGGNELINLEVGVDLMIDQLPVLRGSVLRIDEVIIE